MKKKTPITVDHLWQLDRVAGASLSPDGAQAVCSVTSYAMDKNQGSTSLWLLSTFGGAPRRLTQCGDKDGQPQWSPRGDRIAFIARREQQGDTDAAPQLYLIAPDGGEAVRASHHACGVEAFKWFPDGKRIAFITWLWPEERGDKAQARRHKAEQERKESAYVTTEVQHRWWDRNLPMGRVPHLLVLDVASGKTIELLEGSGVSLPLADPDAAMFDIAPDGRQIAFVFDPQPVQRAENVRALAEIDLRSRRIRRLVDDTGWNCDAPRYSPDGTRIAFIASHQGLRQTMPGWLASTDRRGAWTLHSDGWDRSVARPLRWAADAASILFTAEDRGRCPLWRFDLAARSAAIVVPGGWVREFDAAGDTVLVAADSQGHPTQLRVVRGAGPAARIERFNDPLLDRLALGNHEAIDVSGALGEPVQVWLTYPPGFDRKRRHPLLHSIHGGPHAAAGDTWHWRWNTQVFAAQGYVVASVNYHGSSGFGDAFGESITQRYGALELQDIEAATDHLLGQKWIDRKRVFASGGSYGGYLVAWMNAHLPAGRYHAYVCHAGCWDWVSMFGGDAPGWFKKELGAHFWDDMARVHAQSPHAFAKGLTTPTLVSHGALDYRVPDAQGLAYYNTLKAQAIDARLVWFPDENHWVLKPRNTTLWYAEFFGWLARHDPALKSARRAASR